MTVARLMILGVILVAFLISTTPALAQETEVVAGEELEYQSLCDLSWLRWQRAWHHGQVSYLFSDLIQLAKKTAGRFPFWQVYRVIDGREELRGHGTREMPIWGARFQSEARGDDPGSRSQAAGRILGLVFYLQHIQE